MTRLKPCCLAQADRPFTANVLEERLKFTPDQALKAYDDVIAGFDERGNIPDMDMFWTIKKEAKEVTETWPREKYFDDRYLASFAQWAP